MKHLKLLILFSVFVLCLVASSADAIEAGVNPDIYNNTGQEATDFHVKGRLKSGWPGLNWADPPTLVYHIDDVFQDFSYSISPDSSSPGQNEYVFTADWKNPFDGVPIPPGGQIHIGLMLDLYCNNLIIELEGWWTYRDEEIGKVLIPGFMVLDTGLDPQDPDGNREVPQLVQILNQSGMEPGFEIPRVMAMDVAVVKEWMIQEFFGGEIANLFELLNERQQGQLELMGIQWRGVPEEIIPEDGLDFTVDSFFDVFFDIEIPSPDGSGETEPLVTDFQPGDILIDRVGIITPDRPNWSWSWHLHKSHGLDFGDAPEDLSVGYPTTLSLNGARHIIQGPWFGDRSDRPDHDFDGQPEPLALGDDLDIFDWWESNDDEDGITIPPLTPGAIDTILVEVSNGGGWVEGWIDFNQDSQWSAAELVVSAYLPVGVNPVLISVPATAVPGQTFARFRIIARTPNSLGGIGSPVGLARSGEVEDHEVKIIEGHEELDFGDAPDSLAGALGYPTYLANNGARHLPGGPWLGADDDMPDYESDGQPTVLADGDDILDGNDDEDGVSIPLLIAGQAATISFTVNGGGGIVEGWIDFNQNMIWEASELVVSAYYFDGPKTKSIIVPSIAGLGQTYARFRISVNGSAGSPVGEAADGEVEDLIVDIEEPQPEIDWGDAPDSVDAPGYPTLLSNNGANHIIGGPWLGPDDDKPDPDPDGQPTPPADGDDVDGNDDEDGVNIPILIGGKPEKIIFQVNGGGGYVTGWIDYDQSMSWELSELVVNGSYGDGIHSVVVNVPCDAAYGKTYARFRIVNSDVLPITPTPEGPAPNGEVEDYVLEIKDPCHWPPNADINGDGQVDLVDFSIMASQWLNGVGASS